MEIACRTENDTTIVKITGRMDAITAPSFEKALNERIAEGGTQFVMEMSGLEYISSAGLRGILATAKALKGKGGWIRFAAVGGAVKEVFDISGFGSIFRMYDSVSGALAEPA